MGVEQADSCLRLLKCTQVSSSLFMTFGLYFHNQNLLADTMGCERVYRDI